MPRNPSEPPVTHTSSPLPNVFNKTRGPPLLSERTCSLRDSPQCLLCISQPVSASACELNSDFPGSCPSVSSELELIWPASSPGPTRQIFMYLDKDRRRALQRVFSERASVQHMFPTFHRPTPRSGGGTPDLPPCG